MFPLLINPIAIMISLSTTAGVLLHDTYIDQAARTALTGGVVIMSTYELIDKSIKFGDPHTHSERGSMSQMTRDFKAQHPRVIPRYKEDRKHMNKKRQSMLQFGYDNYFEHTA